MKKNKKQVYYTLYTFNKFKNDYEYLTEYTNIDELKKDMSKKGVKESGIYNYFNKSIDSINKLINGKIAIIKEVE